MKLRLLVHGVYTMQNKPLILITRPEPQNKILAEQLTKLGFINYLLPTVAIAPLFSKDTLKNKLNTLLPDTDLFIFVSQHAVHYFQGLLTEPLKIPCLAIGPATSLALEKCCQNILALPTEYNSESLLQHESLQHIKNKRIVIVCGKNSRTLLANTLRDKGAKLTIFAIYQRMLPATLSSEKISYLQQHHFAFIVTTSLETLKNLVILVKPIQDWLFSQNLIVISDKMAAYAKQIGFSKKIIIADNASNEAIIRCLKKCYTE